MEAAGIAISLSLRDLLERSILMPGWGRISGVMDYIKGAGGKQFQQAPRCVDPGDPRVESCNDQVDPVVSFHRLLQISTICPGYDTYGSESEESGPVGTAQRF